MEKLVLLSDSDGTLFNTFSLYDEALEHVFHKYIEDRMTLEELRAYMLKDLPKGLSWRNLLKNCMDYLDIRDQTLDEFEDSYYDYLIQRFVEHEELLLPHTRRLLQTLQKLSIPVVIQSAGNRRLMDVIYQHFGLESFIQGMVCGSDFDLSDKEVIIAHAAKIIPAENYVVFGDSPMDINGGYNLGFLTAKVADTSEWEAAHKMIAEPNYVFTGDVDDFIRFLKGITQ